MARKNASPKGKSSQVSSKSGVRAALLRLEQIQRTSAALEEVIEEKCKAENEMIGDFAVEAADLKRQIEDYVLQGKEGDKDFDDGTVKITKVQGHRREWSKDALKTILPHAIFKQITTTVIVPAKIDELVKKGEIDDDLIEKAYIETENKPYIKWTTTKPKNDKSTNQANALAEALS